MAVSFLANVVSDLCLGKPALRSLSISATIADALAALKSTDDNFVSVWDCVDHSAKVEFGDDNVGVDHECRCVGKVCMVDVICYLCRDENLLSPSAALKAPVSAILPKIPGLVRHLEPSSRSLIQILIIWFFVDAYFSFFFLPFLNFFFLSLIIFAGNYLGFPLNYISVEVSYNNKRSLERGFVQLLRVKLKGAIIHKCLLFLLIKTQDPCGCNKL